MDSMASWGDEWGGEALLVAVVILMNIASLALYCPWPSLAAIADPRKMVLSVSLVHLSQDRPTDKPERCQSNLLVIDSRRGAVARSTHFPAP